MCHNKIKQLLDEVSDIVNTHYNNLLYQKQGVKLLHEKFMASIQCSYNLGRVILKDKGEIMYKVSTNGKTFIKKEEGEILKPYKCPAGIWTISVGCTTYQNGTAVKGTDRPLTQNESNALFSHHLIKVENWLNKNCTWIKTQNQFDALASFIHQYGTGFENKYPNSYKTLKAGNEAEIVKLLETSFVNIVAGSGKKELLPRRKRETALFIKK